MQMLVKKYEAASHGWWEYHFGLMNRLISMRVSLAPGGGSSQAQLDRQPSYGELERKLGHLAPFAGGEAVRNDLIQEALPE